MIGPFSINPSQDVFRVGDRIGNARFSGRGRLSVELSEPARCKNTRSNQQQVLTSLVHAESLASSL